MNQNGCNFFSFQRRKKAVKISSYLRYSEIEDYCKERDTKKHLSSEKQQKNKNLQDRIVLV